MESYLKPLEEVRGQYNCSMDNGKNDGVMIVTNIRLIFKQFNQPFFRVQAMRFHPVKLHIAILQNRKNNHWVMQASYSGNLEKYTFRFKKDNLGKEMCESAKRLLD